MNNKEWGIDGIIFTFSLTATILPFVFILIVLMGTNIGYAILYCIFLLGAMLVGGLLVCIWVYATFELHGLIKKYI